MQSTNFALDNDVRALDELFTLTSQYRTTQAYHNLLQFVARFRVYSPFNAMLVHIQMPGALYVAPPNRWLHEWRHRVRPGARPLVILQPKGPVMFVFDVSDVEPTDGAKPLPRGIAHPFEARSGKIRSELDRLVENAKRDGVRIGDFDAGSQGAGQIAVSRNGGVLDFVVGTTHDVTHLAIPIRYELLLNRQHSSETRFATIAHELSHLYCGH